MSMTTRLNLVFVISALLMGIVASTVTGLREYHTQLEQLTRSSASQLLARPDLQFHIYRNDIAAMEETLEDFFQQAAVAGAIIYNNTGTELVSRDNPIARTFNPADFTTVRGDALTLDEVLVAFDGSQQPIDLSLLNSVIPQSTPAYFSLPIFTLVNPAERRLTEADFAIALTSPNRSQSQWVIGYLHLLLDRNELATASLLEAGKVFIWILVLVIVCSIAGWLVGRRITRPLQQLGQLADDIAAGEVKGPVHLEGPGEMQDVARVINTVLGGVKNFKAEQEIGNRLLSLKVEQRTSQLTERNAQLNKVVGEVKKTRSRLHHMSNYDKLTQLPNRQLFSEQLDLLLKLNHRNKQNLALLFIDLDEFKRVNDSLGLATGDRLLQEVAQRLSRAVRESDSIGHLINSDADIAVSRLGGDEFTVVLNEVESEAAVLQVADRIMQTLQTPFNIDEHELVIKPAVGIAMAPEHGAEVEDLIKAASVAKWHAKKTTGSGIEVYNPGMGEEGQNRLRLEADLRRAIERNELSLHYQPQVDTRSGSVAGVEALLRWEHPEEGMIPPGDFIRLAEEIGVIEELGDWVLVEACRQVQTFNRAGVKLKKVAINISALQFDTEFISRIREVIRQFNIAPEQLELALTESIMTSNDKETVEALQALKETGIYLSVDDFGTGYSPLTYLSQYPLDEIKIAREFLLDSGRSEAGAKLIVAIIAMARSLGLRVLVTGVETHAQFKFLSENGAGFLQGYLFSPPVPANKLKPMLAPWHFVDQVQRLSEAPAPRNTQAP
ncbi:EAL domain-containing protein [Halioglobus maricola]|uniref:EAL domain-containing protein n=1 Tax=Halioglobus maricola TaxID=2601894 RepID=A0A5P9NL51_9GAMM|nr:EAL domain-containing protein [Halioglobus maricola]QFU75668.1 EAL domain-containing protein [Halioglobus maricola]